MPLVRVGFPIHDRIGGQRILHVGYRGTQQLFDRIVNALIEADAGKLARRLQLHMRGPAMNYDDHPCFSENGRHTAARVHLPVAPKCNMQCNYCDRDYACVNESRPGVTSTVLTPVAGRRLSR